MANTATDNSGGWTLKLKKGVLVARICCGTGGMYTSLVWSER